MISFFSIEQLSSSEDLLALAGLGFAGIVSVWAASNLVSVTTIIFFLSKKAEALNHDFLSLNFPYLYLLIFEHALFFVTFEAIISDFFLPILLKDKLLHS
jgi:hypothetical protein